MGHKWFAGALLAGAVVWSIGGTVTAADKRPIDVIEDDSFLIEEAYNQEPGVVQHIFTAAYTKSGRTQGGDSTSPRSGRYFPRITSCLTRSRHFICAMTARGYPVWAISCLTIATSWSTKRMPSQRWRPASV